MPGDVEIIIRHQTPAFRAYPPMVFLDKVLAAFGIAAARELHHLRPLVKAAELVALGGIVAIAVAFNFVVIALVFDARDHLADIQVFSHDGHGIPVFKSVFTDNLDVVVTAAIARVGELVVGVFANAPVFGQRFRMVKGHVLAAAAQGDTTAAQG